MIVDGANCTEIFLRFCCGSWSSQSYLKVLYLEDPNARKLKMTHYVVEWVIISLSCYNTSSH